MSILFAILTQLDADIFAPSYCHPASISLALWSDSVVEISNLPVPIPDPLPSDVKERNPPVVSPVMFPTLSL